MAYVVIRNGSGAELGRYAIEGPTILGRATECEISLRDARLSRLHCRIDREGDTWSLTDLGSKNGTMVNDQAIESYQLQDCDVFRLADWRITFHTGNLPPKRPKDPLEAEQTATVSTSTDDIVGDANMNAVVPSTKDGSTVGGVAPLAFKRPPAAPKVDLPPKVAPAPKRRHYTLPIAVLLLGIVAMAALYWYIFTH